MSEIKFRAWDKENRKMYNVDSIYFYYKKVELDVFEEPYRRAIFRYFNDINFLQFTGFYDENGKEIYEGDVVKATYEEYRPEFDVIQTFDRIEQVIFVNGAFQLKMVYDDIVFLRPFCEMESENLVSLQSIEVLGNIYENPELLEKEYE